MAQAYDEFGNPEDGTAATRYGWIGAEQRSAETPTGLVLMGIRLYDPATGRFLQPDPIPSFTTGAYDYAGEDPANSFDISGAYRHAKVIWGWTGVTVAFDKRGTGDVGAGMWPAIAAAAFVPRFGVVLAFLLTVDWFVIDRMHDRGWCVAATAKYYRNHADVWFYKGGFCR